MMPDPPLALLAELTHRCPLRCPYCSNPLRLERASDELGTAEWQQVLDEAAALGVLQVHFSGGEPASRPDLEELVGHACRLGLYANLITSGLLLDVARLDRLAAAGLDHVQISLQDSDEVAGDRIAGRTGAQAAKRRLAEAVTAAGLALTVNLVVHRHNLARLAAMVALAAELGAQRLEVAHVQYYGWALRNRPALLPSREQVDEAVATVAKARAGLAGRLVIDHVVPDHHARRPKPCMGGWGRRFINISPSGRVLPCHAAETIPGLAFERVGSRPLCDIWRDGAAFQHFRGSDWLPEPCRSCERRDIDWGGCRCQALALAGDAATVDPVCDKAPGHAALVRLVEDEAAAGPELVYRGAPP